MIKSKNPWEGLSTPPPDEYSSFRVSTKIPHDFFWANNEFGQSCLLFSCNLTDVVRLDSVTLKGLEVKQINDQKKQKLHLVVTLIDLPSKDLFRQICLDLIISTKKIPQNQPGSVIRALNTRLKRWQNLFSKKGNDLLSSSAQLGLFGELLFLKDIVIENLGTTAALDAWQGHNGSEQDFEWSQFLIEVKTSRSSSDKVANISSLEQFDNISGEIWLIYQTLATDIPGSLNQLSLLRLVDQIRDLLGKDLFAHDKFEIALMEFGYEDNENYDKDNFSLSLQNFYKVDTMFPKITRSDTPSEILRANYVLDITAIEERCVKKKNFLERVFTNE